jgi:hypothetical protein
MCSPIVFDLASRVVFNRGADEIGGQHSLVAHSSHIPSLRRVFSAPELTNRPLAPSTVSRTGRFVDTYDSKMGRSMLQNLQVDSDGFDSALTRAQWFVDHKTLPTEMSW